MSKPANGLNIEMKPADEWAGRSHSVANAKETKDDAVPQRRFGATMVPQKKSRNIAYDVEIYKAFGGDAYVNDSADEDNGRADLPDDTAPGAEPFNPNGIPDAEKPKTEVARATIAGVNTWSKTYFFLMKAFLGSGMLTLPMGFCNGGALFSVVCMAVMCTLSALGMSALLEARNVKGGSYSDVAFQAMGKPGRLLIDVSLACAQVKST